MYKLGNLPRVYKLGNLPRVYKLGILPRVYKLGILPRVYKLGILPRVCKLGIEQVKLHYRSIKNQTQMFLQKAKQFKQALTKIKT